MSEIRPGEMIVQVIENGLTHAAADGNTEDDIIIRGWLTTEKRNSYDQVVRAKAFGWKGGFQRFNGRMLFQHGTQYFKGGGDDTPIGQWNTPRIIDGEGLFSSGLVWKENDPLLKRALRDGVLNAISIGFMPIDWEEHNDGKKGEEQRWVEFTKAQLFEASIVGVGANDEALLEIVHSMNKRATYNNLPKYRHVMVGGVVYTLNERGDICDG